MRSKLYRPRPRAATVIATLVTVAAASAASAQTPGLPVLQNAFANPGLAFAANIGSGSGQSFFGAAAALGLGGGRLLVSGAAGAQRGNDATRGAYGGRVSGTLWTSPGGSLGLGAFVGFGGAPRTRGENDVTTNPAVMTVPAGVSVGYRRPLGARRGFSVYASPMYRWTRATANDVTANDVTASSGAVAGAVGVDFAVTPSIGVTAGADFGKASGATSTNSVFGFAISFVPGR